MLVLSTCRDVLATLRLEIEAKLLWLLAYLSDPIELDPCYAFARDFSLKTLHVSHIFSDILFH